MAFVSVGSLFAIQTKSVTDPWIFGNPFTAQLDAGNLGVMILGTDNITTTDGNTSDHITVTDSVGNIWVKGREFTNGQGGAAAGATVSIWYTVATTNLPTTGTITVDFNGVPTNAATATGWEFTKTAGTTIVLDGGTDVANDGAAPGSLSISSLANIEHLFIRGIADEGVTTTFTKTANYTNFTSASTAGGGGASNMSVYGEFRILTGTSSTSAPSLTTASNDKASAMIAISELSSMPNKTYITLQAVKRAASF